MPSLAVPGRRRLEAMRLIFGGKRTGGEARSGRFRRLSTKAIASALAVTVCSSVTAASSVNAEVGDERRSVYAIAHGVNNYESLDRALAAGANGIETDICANTAEPGMAPWYVAHDCDGPRGKPSTFDMFTRLAGLPVGHRPLLVWLDIKTPDACAHARDLCSTRGLADQAKLLTRRNIQVLYDLTGEDYEKNKPTLGGPGYANLKSTINAQDHNGVPLEGVGFWGDTETALKVFGDAGVPPGQRALEVGDCGSIHSDEVERDVDSGVAERDKQAPVEPQLAAVLVWTMYTQGIEECDNVLDRIDGIIAGHHNFGQDERDAATLKSVTETGGTDLAQEGHRLFRK